MASGTLNIVVERKWNKRELNYCVGNIYLNGRKVCNSMEPADWGLKSSMSVEEIKAIKASHTDAPIAIPIGTYRVVLDIVSPKYKNVPFYNNLCNGGRVPRLFNVKGFDGVLIHAGSIAGKYGQTDTLACLLPGDNIKTGMVLNSRIRFEQIYKEMLKYKDIFITYTYKYGRN